MAKFKVSKSGKEKLILTGDEIKFAAVLANVTRLGDSPLKIAAYQIMNACTDGGIDPDVFDIQLGVTVSVKSETDPNLEVDQKFSEFNPNTFLTLEFENQ